MTLVSTAELRSALGEPGSGEVHNHPSPALLIAAQKQGRQEAMRSLLDAGEARGTGDLLASEQREFRGHKGVLDLLSIYESELADSPEARSGRAFQKAGLRGAYVRAEPRQYDAEAPHGYFRDLAQATLHGDLDARQRLQHHAMEVAAEPEYRDINRTDGTGGYAVPPLWLMDQYVALARAGRPTADLVTKLDLPGGTDSINIPKLSSGTATAIQAADNAAVQETDLADTSITAPVRTIAGQQDVALQAIEQSPAAFDQIIFQDLIADLNTKIDLQVISGSGSSGQIKGLTNASGINAVTFTSGSPTVALLYSKIADAVQRINTLRFLPPTAIVMHPRRWGWFLAALDTSNRPLVVPSPQGPFNAFATPGAPAAENFVGTLLGLPVVTDPSITVTNGAGTNEDIIIVMRAQDLILWESPVKTRVLPDVGSGTLTLRLQAYCYVAGTAERYPAAISIVSGSGLSTPSY